MKRTWQKKYLFYWWWNETTRQWVYELNMLSQQGSGKVAVLASGFSHCHGRPNSICRTLEWLTALAQSSSILLARLQHALITFAPGPSLPIGPYCFVLTNMLSTYFYQCDGALIMASHRVVMVTFCTCWHSPPPPTKPLHTFPHSSIGNEFKLYFIIIFIISPTNWYMVCQCVERSILKTLFVMFSSCQQKQIAFA